MHGLAVGDGGRFGPAVSRNGNRPLFVPVPAGILHAGTNVVAVRVATPPTMPGILGPVALGPERTLPPRSERQLFQQATISYAAIGITVMAACLVALLYFRRDPTRQHRWFVAGALVMRPSPPSGTAPR